MEYEVDFLPVGDGERGGDAICLRYGNFNGARSEYIVIVIDGGTNESGKAIVEHVKKYYGTEDVDLVLSTHPDGDHCCGLTVVLDNLKVTRLWMHKPWEHAEDIRNLFKCGRITDTSLRENLKKALENAHDLYELAVKKNIPVVELFSDTITGGPQLFILGPSKDFYQSLLPHFRETPQPKHQVPSLQKILQVAIEAAKEGIKWVAENWGFETLTDPEPYLTSFENNSSVILCLKIDENILLLTSDAGVEALEEASKKAELLGIDLKKAKFIQIPHHGSRRNVGPTILDKIVGPKIVKEDHIKTAFVSVPKNGDPKHPSRRVLNAFKRRGAGVIPTKGSAKCHFSKGVPQRQDWSPVTPLPLYVEVEE